MLEIFAGGQTARNSRLKYEFYYAREDVIYAQAGVEWQRWRQVIEQYYKTISVMAEVGLSTRTYKFYSSNADVWLWAGSPH